MSDPDPSAVAARIRSERLRLGLSLNEVARRLGVHKNSYRPLETSANPRLSKLVELVRLGYDLRAVAPELFAPACDADTSSIR